MMRRFKFFNARSLRGAPRWFYGAFVLGPALYPLDASQVVRENALRKYFQPPPGAVVDFSPRDMLDDRISEFKKRGEIIVTPPKHQCLIVRRSDDMPDVNVCKRSVLTFTPEHLDERGQIKWRVISGKDDDGTDLTWKTHHRLARVIPAGSDKDTDSTLTLVMDCMQSRDNPREVIVTLFGGKRIVIDFPSEHTLASDQPPAMPNLFHGQDLNPDAPTKKSEEAETPYQWQIPRRDSYEMPSTRVRTAGAVEGGRGRCRYRLRGAPKDPGIGVIECVETNMYDAFLIPLTCAPQK